MFERYLLAIAKSPVLWGLRIFFLLPFVIGVTLLNFGETFAGVAMVLVAVVVGPILSVVQTVLVRKHVVYVGKSRGKDSGQRWLLRRMPNGTIVASDRFLREGRVMLVTLPPVRICGSFSEEASFMARVVVTWQSEHSVTTAEIEFRAFVPLTFNPLGSFRKGILPYGFDPKKVWDFMGGDLSDAGGDMLDRFQAALSPEVKAVAGPYGWEACCRVSRTANRILEDGMRKLGNIRSLVVMSVALTREQSYGLLSREERKLA